MGTLWLDVNIPKIKGVLKPKNTHTYTYVCGHFFLSTFVSFFLSPNFHKSEKEESFVITPDLTKLEHSIVKN